MSKVYLGRKIEDMDVGEPLLPVTGVRLNVDSETYFEAGDKSGSVIERDCPWATQEMANHVLEKLRGFVYKPFSASNALLDPAAELNDGITVGGEYFILAQIGRDFDRLSLSSVGAPTNQSEEEEYPYKSKQRKETDRVLAKTRSLITKTAEEIRMEVQSEVDNLSSSFSVQLQSITARVDGLNGAYAELQLTVDGLTVSGPGGTTYIRDDAIQTGSITADKIDATELKVSAANITGTLSASQVNLTGAIEFTDLSASVNNSISGISSIAIDAYNNANAANNKVSGWTYTGTTYIDGTKILTGTVTASHLRGGTISLINGAGTVSGSVTLSSATSGAYAVDIQSYAAMRLFANSGDMWIEADGTTSSYLWLRGTTAAPTITCNATFRPSEAGIGTFTLGDSYHKWGSVYSVDGVIQTSDRNAKHDVIDIPDEYVDLFMGLRPRLYKYDSGTSDRYHVGYIAQEVEQAMLAAGISSKDFAALVIDYDDDGNKIYMLRYEEFMALHTMMIQRLVSKVG